MLTTLVVEGCLARIAAYIQLLSCLLCSLLTAFFSLLLAHNTHYGKPPYCSSASLSFCDNRLLLPCIASSMPHHKPCMLAGVLEHESDGCKKSETQSGCPSDDSSSCKRNDVHPHSPSVYEQAERLRAAAGRGRQAFTNPAPLPEAKGDAPLSYQASTDAAFRWDQHSQSPPPLPHDPTLDFCTGLSKQPMQVFYVLHLQHV